jgi:hypothetical protein
MPTTERLQRIKMKQLRPYTDKYETLHDQINGMSKPWLQTQIAEEGQTNFVIQGGTTYQVGTGQLEVYFNGQMVQAGLDNDYREVSEMEIQFNFACSEGDIITFRIEGSGGGITTSDHAHYFGVVPTGQVNGINKIFQLPHIPRYNCVALFIGGVRQSNDKFTLTVNRIEIKEAPIEGQEILIDYIV